MWLNSALVYSFLFTSAVLAGSPSGKLKQPPALLRDRGQRSIYRREEVVEWSGAGWLMETNNTHVAGTVSLPAAQGFDTSAFMIIFGMGGLLCGDVTIGGGITVNITNNVTTYTAWANYYEDVQYFSSDEVPLSTGHPIRITVDAQNSTSGTVTLQNIALGKSGTKNLQGATPLCREDAAWLASVPLESYMPLPNFYTLTFTGMEVDGKRRPKRADLYPSNIAENGDFATSLVVADQFVVTKFIVNENRGV